jgi:septum formation protein
MKDTHLYLASASPRRRQLLSQIGVDFLPLSVHVDESQRPAEEIETFVTRLALDKARAGWDRLGRAQQAPVLGADTLVVVDGHPMGKPGNRREGIAMLQALSGRIHAVLSAVALKARQREAVRMSRSFVTFRTLAPGECAAYWESGEPSDKAGAYAIQGLGAMFISHLDGSYSGVMGLPLFETAELLHDFGIKIPLRCAPAD